MIEKIDHIGILVEDIGTAREIYEQLGMTMMKTEYVEGFDVEIAFMSGGDELIELVEPLSKNNEFKKLLNTKEHTGLLHHIAFRVDDIEATLSVLKEANISLLDSTPRAGADGARVAFLEQGAGNGVEGVIE